MEFDQPIPVSVFIQLLNTHLENLRGKIMGEITSIKKWSSGHVYFDLKDPSDESVLSCVIWKYNYQLMGIPLEEGMQIVATGKPNVYAKSGRLSFVADAVEYAGEGALKRAYDLLRAQLTSEGLFDESKKRPVPKYVRTIGVITSKQGAVIHDFENNLGQWGFRIKFVDSRVEGKEAVKDLLDAITTMKKQNIDALVIMRGGGSRASLAAFDTESLVRAIADFPVPVIAAIGHHEDVPLMVLAADIAVSTPTAAAHVFNSAWEEYMYRLENYRSLILSSYAQRLSAIDQFVDSYNKNILQLLRRNMSTLRERIEYFEKVVASNDPERQLRLGYSIVRKDGKVLKSTKHVTIGDALEIQVSDGHLKAEIT